MFYSHCLLSRNGVLKTIWVAAYFHKKLKKHQVSQTDISSSVDEIMQHEVTVPYRVLGYLLLGVVRIYSMKVEYLQHDYDEVLRTMKNYRLLKRSNRGTLLPNSSIVLPEKFELDQFFLDLPDNVCDKNTAPLQQITLKERFGDADNGNCSFEKYQEEEDLVRFDISSAAYTPIQDALSPDSESEVTYTKLRASNVAPSSETRMERLLDNELPADKSSDTGISCEAEISVELGAQFNEFDSQLKQIKFLEVTPPGTAKSCVLDEGDPLADMADGTQNSWLPANIAAATPELMPCCTPAKEQPQLSGKRKCLFDDTMVASNKSMRQSLHYSSLLARCKAPMSDLDVSKQQNTPNYQDFMKPNFPCTPQLNASIYRCVGSQLQFSAKRKHIFDEETILLADELIRENLRDTNGIIIKRRKVPFSALDVWKECKLLNDEDFLEPLISCAPELKFVFDNRSAGNPKPQISRERKQFFDENTVLSDKVIKQNPNKRRDAPESALSIWKAYELPNLCHDFMEPVIPCGIQLKTLFYGRRVKSSQPLASESLIGLGEDKNDTHKKLPGEGSYSCKISGNPVRLGEDRYETYREPSQENAHSVDILAGSVWSDEDRYEILMVPFPERGNSLQASKDLSGVLKDSYETHKEPSQENTCSLEVSDNSFSSREDIQGESSLERANSENNMMDDSTWNSDETPTTSRGSVSDIAVLTVPVSGGGSYLSEPDAQDNGLNLMDEEVHQEEASGNQKGWSVRTSALASFLRKRFVKLKEQNSAQGVNVAPVLEGRTRKENARTFYEILVLKSRGFVDAKQRTPYGDIILLSTPQLMSTV